MVNKKIEAHEQDLLTAMEANDYNALNKALNSCSGVDINVKLRHKAEVTHQKLEQEIRITTFIKEKTHHDNYKDIRKDVERINNYLTQAENQEIKLDDLIIA